MKENFPISLQATLKWEGGYVNDPRDPGGSTYEGVTQTTYNLFRRNRDLPIRSVVSMDHAERDEIYKTKYWDMANCDDLAAGVDLLSFDIAVNSGPGRVLKWLHDYNEKDPFQCISYLDYKRRGFWKNLPIFRRFGSGWLNRENDILYEAVKLAAQRSA
jgi:lysozyme family protein